MFVFTTTFRVLYADTDNMKFVYYGNYARYYEMARSEAMRSLGYPYSELEKAGIAMPVIQMSVNYIKPAFYDQLLQIKVMIEKLPETRILFKYEIYNDKELINRGETTLIFLDVARNRPVRAPSVMLEKLREYFI